MDTDRDSEPKNLNADIKYEMNPPVSNEKLRELFIDAWPEQHHIENYQPVLRQGLGYVCAYKEGELIGFANAAWDGGAHVFLLDTTVRSDFRHQGIGRKLVRHVEELARKSGAEWLHVDFELRYEEFYRKCGFRESRAGLMYLK
jgi:GNAT superfamily N-acetyltransferase